MARRATRGSDDDVNVAKHSAMSERLKASISRTYDLDSADTERILVAGMLLRVREMLLRELDSILNRFGTSHARYQVLSIVCNSSHGLQLGEIVERASVHPTTMTSTIDRLVRDGLIERQADPDDRRGVLAIATPKGQKLYRQARAELGAITYGLSELPSETARSLLDGLDELALVLERRAPTE